MDQDSFRYLLTTNSSTGSTPRNVPFVKSRGNILSSSTKSKTVAAPQPAFKPRKVKKPDAELKYRDRAAERREGGGNDYAHVEAVLEDFEQRNATNEDKKLIEEQRKYLGGDGEHSILVKGLDMALLEQNKARAALDSIEDDDTLEQAYIEASTTVPQKRTRADIINELKRKRVQQGSTEQESEDNAKPPITINPSDTAMKQGKFKPIGFKPIGSSEDNEKKKKAKSGDGAKTRNKTGEERKKKKRKVGGADSQPDKELEPPSTTAKQISEPTATPTSAPKIVSKAEVEPETLEDEFNIFADVDEYEAVDVGSDDEAEGETEAKSPSSLKRRDNSPKPAPSRGWFTTGDSEDERPAGHSKPSAELVSSHNTGRRSPSLGRRTGEIQENGERKELDEAEEEKPMRLQPLEGSALPSIRDFLAMDEAAEAAEKRRKRKEKKKAGGGGGVGGGGGDDAKSREAKVNRDFQRLQSYTNKKEASGSR